MTKYYVSVTIQLPGNVSDKKQPHFTCRVKRDLDLQIYSISQSEQITSETKSKV